MAYKVSGLQLVQPRVATGYPAVWLYQGIDPVATVNGAAWFSNGADQGMLEGDLVFLQETDNNFVTYLLQVVKTGSGAATTATIAQCHIDLMPNFAELLALVASLPRSGAKVETLAADKTLTAAESGKTYFLGVATGCDVTLPAVAAGLEFEFIVSVSPTSNGYTINSEGGDDVIVVETSESETDTDDDGPYDVNADILTLVANVAVIGDRIRMICDGTKWYARGHTNADGGMTSGTT